MYVSAEIASRIKEIARQKNIVIAEMLRNIGLGFNTMNNLKTSMPKADNLAKIADVLGCSVDFLLGRTDRDCLDAPGVEELSEDEKILLDRYRQLDSLGQEIVRAKAGELLQNLQRGTGALGAENESGDFQAAQ